MKWYEKIDKNIRYGVPIICFSLVVSILISFRYKVESYSILILLSFLFIGLFFAINNMLLSARIRRLIAQEEAENKPLADSTENIPLKKAIVSFDAFELESNDSALAVKDKAARLKNLIDDNPNISLPFDYEKRIEEYENYLIERKHRLSFVSLVLRTTGFGDLTRIIEICASKVYEGKIIDRFYSLVNPELLISDLTTIRTGITQESVKDQPTIMELMPRLSDFIDNKQVIMDEYFSIQHLTKAYQQSIQKEMAKEPTSIGKIYLSLYQKVRNTAPVSVKFEHIVKKTLSNDDLIKYKELTNNKGISSEAVALAFMEIY